MFFKTYIVILLYKISRTDFPSCRHRDGDNKGDDNAQPDRVEDGGRKAPGVHQGGEGGDVEVELV
jgi:hypothetical protein